MPFAAAEPFLTGHDSGRMTHHSERIGNEKHVSIPGTGRDISGLITLAMGD